MIDEIPGEIVEVAWPFAAIALLGFGIYLYAKLLLLWKAARDEENR